MRPDYCTYCGQRLVEVRAFPDLWAEFLKCQRSRHAFVRVHRNERSLYPLIEVHSRKGEKVLEYGTAQEIHAAFDLLTRVDQYTLASAEFNWRLEVTWFKEIVDRKSTPTSEP